MLRTAGGRLFQVWGSQTEKARLPKWVLVRFTTAALVSDDLSWRRCEFAVLNSTRSVRYDGQRLWRIWCISVAFLKIMRNLTGSQCNCCSAEVICDCRSRLSQKQKQRGTASSHWYYTGWAKLNEANAVSFVVVKHVLKNFDNFWQVK